MPEAGTGKGHSWGLLPLFGPDFSSIHFTEMLYSRCGERSGEQGRAWFGNLQHLNLGLPRSTGPTNKYVCTGEGHYIGEGAGGRGSQPALIWQTLFSFMYPSLHSLVPSFTQHVWSASCVPGAMLPAGTRESTQHLAMAEDHSLYLPVVSAQLRVGCTAASPTGHLTRERGTVLLGTYGVHTFYAPCHVGLQKTRLI